MATNTNVDSYVNRISDALHSTNFNETDFLNTIRSVLSDFSNNYSPSTGTATGTTNTVPTSGEPDSGMSSTNSDSGYPARVSPWASGAHQEISQLEPGTTTASGTGVTHSTGTNETSSAVTHTPTDTVTTNTPTDTTVTHTSTSTDGSPSFSVDHSLGTLVNDQTGQPVQGFTARITTPDAENTQDALNPDFYAKMADLGADIVRLDVTGAVDGRTIDEQIPLIDEAIASAKSAGLGVQLEFSQDSVTMDPAETKAFWEVAAPRYANDQSITYEMTNEPDWPAYDSSTVEAIGDIYHVMRDAAPDKPIGLLDYPIIDSASDVLNDVNQLESMGVDFQNDQTTVAFHGYLLKPDEIQAVQDAGVSVMMTEVTDSSDTEDASVLSTLSDMNVGTFSLAGGFGFRNASWADDQTSSLENFETRTAPDMANSGVDWTADGVVSPGSSTSTITTGNGTLAANSSSSNNTSNTSNTSNPDVNTSNPGYTSNPTSSTNATHSTNTTASTPQHTTSTANHTNNSNANPEVDASNSGYDSGTTHGTSTSTSTNTNTNTSTSTNTTDNAHATVTAGGQTQNQSGEDVNISLSGHDENGTGTANASIDTTSNRSTPGTSTVHVTATDSTDTHSNTPSNTASNTATTNHWSGWDTGSNSATDSSGNSSGSIPASGGYIASSGTEAAAGNTSTSQVSPWASQAHEQISQLESGTTTTSGSSGSSHSSSVGSGNTDSGNTGSGALDTANTTHETFDGGVGIMDNTWGDVREVNGTIEVTSPADTHAMAGAMVQPTGADAGMGYGQYDFTLSTSNTNMGPYAALWPSTDQWPGPEIDVFEQNQSGAYSTTHWNDNGNDAFNWQSIPGNVDTTQTHTYSVNWSGDSLQYGLDGQVYRTDTENVPQDYAHGGENSSPGVGVLTHNFPDSENPVDNTLTLYDFTYTPNSETVIA